MKIGNYEINITKKVKPKELTFMQRIGILEIELEHAKERIKQCHRSLFPEEHNDSNDSYGTSFCPRLKSNEDDMKTIFAAVNSHITRIEKIEENIKMITEILKRQNGNK